MSAAAPKRRSLSVSSQQRGSHGRSAKRQQLEQAAEPPQPLQPPGVHSAPTNAEEEQALLQALESAQEGEMFPMALAAPTAPPDEPPAAASAPCAGTPAEAQQEACQPQAAAQSTSDDPQPVAGRGRRSAGGAPAGQVVLSLSEDDEPSADDRQKDDSDFSAGADAASSSSDEDLDASVSDDDFNDLDSEDEDKPKKGAVKKKAPAAAAVRKVPPKKASEAAKASAGKAAGHARTSTGAKSPATSPARVSAGKASGGAKKGSGASKGAATSSAAAAAPALAKAAAGPSKRAFTVPTAKKGPAGSSDATTGALKQDTARAPLSAAGTAGRVNVPGEGAPVDPACSVMDKLKKMAGFKAPAAASGAAPSAVPGIMRAAGTGNGGGGMPLASGLLGGRAFKVAGLRRPPQKPT